MSVMTLRALLGAAIALVVSSPPASADVNVVEQAFAPVRGPVLAGEGLAWIHEQDRARRLSVRLGSAGSWREVLAVSRTRRDSLLRADLAASASHLTIEAAEDAEGGDPDGRYGRWQVYWARSFLAGPTTGPFGPLGDACTDLYQDPERSRTTHRPVAMSGARLAFAGPGCTSRSVQDLVTGERFPLPEAAEEFALDGDWVAWTELLGPARGEQIVVRNLRTSAGYRVPDDPSEHGPEDFDVDADGRLVVRPAKRFGSVGDRILWASPSQPVLREVALGRPREVVRVRIEDGTVAALAHAVGDTDSTLTGYVLAGDPSLGPLRRYGRGLNAGDPVKWEAFDFVGRSVAVMVRRCGRVQLLRADRLEDLPRIDHAERCRLRLLRRPFLKLGWQGWRLVMSVSCAGFQPRCYLQDVRATTLGRARRLVARADYPSDRARARIWLTRLGRRLMRRSELRRVRLTARLNDGGSVIPERLHTSTTRVVPATERTNRAAAGFA
jgi:strictosidine synthase-like protein